MGRTAITYTSLLLVVFLVVGCDPSSAGIPTPDPSTPAVDTARPPTSRDEAPSVQDNGQPTTPVGGPYTTLIGVSVEELQQRIGKPAEVVDTKDERMKRWIYPDHGLEVVIWDDSGVFWIDQMKGKVTEDIAIGDSQEKVSKLLRSSWTAPGGSEMVSVDTDHFRLELQMKDGVVVGVQILPRGR